VLIHYVELFGGLVLLVIAADWLVDGSVSLARRLGVPTFVVGLTIIAYGTSLPEFVVSILASFRDVADFAIGNIVGSNVANIGLVLGTTAVINIVAVKSNILYRRDFPFLGLATVLGVICIIDGQVSRIEGGILLTLAAVFTVLCLRTKPDEEEDPGELTPWPKVSALVAIGLVGLVCGAHLMVEGGTEIARAYGISERIIGLTIVAIGTSLPELAASVAAAAKGHSELAIGNVVGSCLFNLAFVMGAAALISPLSVDAGAMKWDLVTMCGLTVGMFVMLRTGRRMSRMEGAVLLVCYAGFLTYLALSAFGPTAVSATG